MKKSTLTFLFSLLAFAFTHAQQWTFQVSNINANNYVQFIDAVDSNVVWGLASSRLGQTNPVQEFTRTVNGGSTWTAGIINNAANHAPSSIMALNGDTAWVAMFNTAGGGTILRTNDGGANWTPQTTATFAAPAGFPNMVHFFNANEGVCMGDPNSGYFEIYTTTDGGATWVRVPQAAIPANGSGEFGITDVFTTVGDSSVFFGTNQGRIYRSANRGLTWNVSSTPYTGFLGSITFKDDNFGIACEADVATTSTDLIFTNNGGITWSLLPTNAAGFTLKQSVEFVPGTDSTFVITSPYTVFGSAFSVDNGVNWKLMDNLIHSDCEFVNATTGWSGGGEPGGPIYRWDGVLTIASSEVAPLTIDVSTAVGTSTQTPEATVINNGLGTQTFNVTMQITGGYTSTKTVTGLAYNLSQQITFDPWTPATTGPYSITVFTQLTGDSNILNDTIVKATTAYNEFVNYGWTTRNPVTNAKFGLASAYVNLQTYPSDSGLVFSTGGADLSGGALIGTNDEFNCITGNWNVAADLPTGKYQYSMHTVKGIVYAIGGYSGGFTPDGNNYSYNVASGSWSTNAPMPVPVGDYASGVYNDSLIYYIGGYDGTADVNLVQVYDPALDSWFTATSKQGNAAAGLRGGIKGNTILIAGGYNQALQATTNEAFLGSITISNPAIITWSALPSYPSGTISRLAAGSSPFLPFSYVLFTGGDPTGSGLEVSDMVWAYDLSQSQWLIGPTKPTAVSNVSNFTPVLYNDSLYMVCIGGYDGTTVTAANEWLNMGVSPFVGINEVTHTAEQILLYPNPAADMLYIAHTQKNVPSATLYDATGKQVMQFYGNAASIASLARGIYTVKITIGNQVTVKRLVKM